MQWIPPGEARRARVDGPYTLDDVGPCRAVPLGEVAARRSVSNRESSTSEEFTPNHRERGHRVNTNPRPNDSDTRCKSWNSLAQRRPSAAVPARDIHRLDAARIGEASGSIQICSFLEQCADRGEGVIVGNVLSFATEAAAKRIPPGPIPAGHVVDFRSVDAPKASSNHDRIIQSQNRGDRAISKIAPRDIGRSEEHTSELQSPMYH